jgi:integrase
MTRAGVQIVLSEATGRPYTSAAFNAAFRRLRAIAGLPADLQARDTRRTALTEAGDGGGTDSQLQSLSGHRNRQSVASYVHPSSTMAADAQAARERARNRSGKIATKKGE